MTPTTTTAAIATPIHGSPRMANASDTGAGPPSCVYGTMPVSTNEIATYNSIEIASDSTTARGRSRCGFFDSSAAVVSVS